MRPRYEVADVLRRSGDEFLGKYNPPYHVRKVISDITTCRTSAKGGHQSSCSKCGKVETSYNSCRNRSCPKCEGHKQAEWVSEREEELLPVPYFHLVFTIPHELNPLVLKHREECLNILFQSVSETLLEVSQRRLKGLPGFFSILHTWGRTLSLHPHIHCVVPGGVWREGEFKRSSQRYLLPVNILSTVFRAKFIAKLKLAELTPDKPVLKKLYSKNWVVYAKPPFGGPEAVLRYLARYTHRIAISNSRITKITSDSVTFNYRDAKEESKLKLCTLSHLEFARRFLQHVPPKAFVRIRYYGFLAHAKKAKLLPKIRLSLESKLGISLVPRKKPPTKEIPAQKLSTCCQAQVVVLIIPARATSRGFKYPDFKSQAIKPFDSS